MEDNTPHQLHIKGAHTQHAHSCLAHHSKGLGEKIVQRLPFLQPLAKLLGLSSELGIAQRAHLRLIAVDHVYDLLQALDLARVVVKQIFKSI